MSILVNNRQVADIRLERVDLRRLLGGYELLFAVQGRTLVPVDDQVPYWFVVHGAQIEISTIGRSKLMLGSARVDQIIRSHQSKYQSHVALESRIALQSRQVVAIEEFCNGQDLLFENVLFGEGGSPGGHLWPLIGQCRLAKTVPRSDWIVSLRAAGVLDVVTIEIPMSVADVPPERRSVADQLRRAQKMFVEGNFPECVARCRAVLDIAVDEPGIKEAWAKALKKLESQRDQMNKEEREDSILAAIRNYTHLAAHPGSAASEQFTRDEARFILTATLASMSHLWNANGSYVR